MLAVENTDLISNQTIESQIRSLFDSNPGKLFLAEDLDRFSFGKKGVRDRILSDLIEEGCVECSFLEVIKPVDLDLTYKTVVRKFFYKTGTVLNQQAAIDEYRKFRGWFCQEVGLECPNCKGTDWIVVESRPAFGLRRRRRSCTSCQTRVTTHEVIVGVEASSDQSSWLAKTLQELERLRMIVAKMKFVLGDAHDP